MDRTVNHPSASLFTLFLPRRLGGFLLLVIMALAAPLIAQAQPITSDSRIKTFVYNPNEVFTITTHYGYQSNIEFGPKETIDTISVGDRVAWQIIPAGRRLFIRAMEENARTNMTVVTNQRAYQFDLRSSNADAVFGSAELTYVVRFFYPTPPDPNAPTPSPYAPQLTALSTPAPLAAPAAPATGNLTPPPPVHSSAKIAGAPKSAGAPEPLNGTPTAFNYRYTYSGPAEIAPTKIYDDGKTTYFKLPPAAGEPKFFIVTARGESIDVPARRTTDGLIAVDAVAPRFRLNQKRGDIIVYNEAGGEVF